MTDTTAQLTVRVVLHHPDTGTTRGSSATRGRPPNAVLLSAVAAVLLIMLAWRLLQPVEETTFPAVKETALPEATPVPSKVSVATPTAQKVPVPVPQSLSTNNPSSAAAVTVAAKRLLSPQVQRFELAADIRGREPIGTLASLLAADRDKTTVKIYCFSEVRDMQGQTLMYRWILNDQLQAEIPVRVGAERWRSSSSKNIGRSMRGSWRVELRSRRGELLADTIFEY